MSLEFDAMVFQVDVVILCVPGVHVTLFCMFSPFFNVVWMSRNKQLIETFD